MPTPRDRLILEAIRTHGRLTRAHIQRLFFKAQRRVASPQAVNARLLKLTNQELIAPIVVSGGRGSGPYAYALTNQGRALLSGRRARSEDHGPVWHRLELAEIRVHTQEALEHAGGQLIEWLGDDALRSLLRSVRGAAVPDALVHWRLPRAEGAFLLELDRGTESLAILTAKVERYRAFFATRQHRQLLPGLGLRPRLAVVVTSGARATRLARWLETQPRHGTMFTIAVSVLSDVLATPLAPVWWRTDINARGSIVE